MELRSPDTTSERLGDNRQDAVSEQDLFLRIAPDYRRSAWYVLAAVLPLMLVCCSVSRLNGESMAGAAARCSMFLLLAAAMVVPLRWATRIDRQGIARRFLFRWDFWPWTDMASGRIQKRHSCAFYDPERPWWRRKLTLGYMADADIALAVQRINRHYRLPAPPPLPEELEIKYGFRRRARLDGKGIELQSPRELRVYLWKEVCRLHVTREDPIRRDFRSLELVLPDRAIELKLISHEYGTSPSWGGASAELINEFFLRHVPADRIEADVVGGRPARRSDVERQIGRAREQIRVFRRCHVIYLTLLVGWSAWAAVTNGILCAVCMAGLGVLLFVPVFLFMDRHLRARCRELEQRLASYGIP